MIEFISHSESETTDFAKSFATQLKCGDILALYGDLGTGKTVFSKGIINALTHINTDVPSPTFTLVQSYDTPTCPIYHFDFYRLKTPEEAFEIGIEDYFNDGISLIEWPEKIGYLLPKKAIKIELSIQNDTHVIRVYND